MGKCLRGRTVNDYGRHLTTSIGPKQSAEYHLTDIVDAGLAAICSTRNGVNCSLVRATVRAVVIVVPTGRGTNWSVGRH